MTGGDLNIAGCEPAHLGALLEKLADVGVKTRLTADSVRVMGDVPIKAADIVTEEYPGFPTDMQAQYMALATQAEGTSIITENIFENRFMHALEMVRMGANIKIEGRRAVARSLAVERGGGAGVRSAGFGFAGAGGAGGGRRVDHRPRVSHRPWLRKHRRETARRGSTDSPHRRDPAQARGGPGASVGASVTAGASRRQMKTLMQNAGADQDHQHLVVGNARSFIHSVHTVQKAYDPFLIEERNRCQNRAT